MGIVGGGVFVEMVVVMAMVVVGRAGQSCGSGQHLEVSLPLLPQQWR